MESPAMDADGAWPGQEAHVKVMTSKEIEDRFGIGASQLDAW